MTTAKRDLDERVSLLDFVLARALFGSALPLFWALGMYKARGWHHESAILDPVGNLCLSAIVLFALANFSWPLLRDRSWAPRMFAPVLSLGCALALVHAALFAMNFAPYLLPPDVEVLIALFGLGAICIPTMTTLLLFRAAREAWTESRTRFATHPRTTVVAIAALGLLGLGALFAVHEVSVRSGLDRLERGGPHAVSAAVPALRIAVLLRGERHLIRRLDGLYGGEPAQQRADCLAALGIEEGYSDF